VKTAVRPANASSWRDARKIAGAQASEASAAPGNGPRNPMRPGGLEGRRIGFRIPITVLPRPFGAHEILMPLSGGCARRLACTPAIILTSLPDGSEPPHGSIAKIVGADVRRL
jgi:hypothetical protein